MMVTLMTLAFAMVTAPGIVRASEAAGSEAKRGANVALVVTNRAGPAFDSKRLTLDDLVSARLGELGLRVMPREIVLGNMRSFSAPGAPVDRDSAAVAAGAEAALLDQASALSLAQNLNADYILHVSISNLARSERKVNAYGVSLQTVEHTLTASYKLLDAGNGGALVGDVLSAKRSDQQNVHVAQTSDGIPDELLGQIAEQAAGLIKARIAAGQIKPATASAPPVAVNIRLECAELNIPDVRVDVNNMVVASGAVFPASPGSAIVEVDGVAIGSAPGVLAMRPGLRRVRISRPGIETWERTINATEGLALNVPVKLTPQELQRWREITKFIYDLKAGTKLTDAQVKLLEGEATRLASSGFKVDVKVNTDENFRFIVPGAQYSAP
jgi:hypothetical protein